MDPKTQYLDEVKALTNQDLFRVRGVDEVEWAVPLYKGLSRAKVPDGRRSGSTVTHIGGRLSVTFAYVLDDSGYVDLDSALIKALDCLPPQALAPGHSTACSYNGTCRLVSSV